MIKGYYLLVTQWELPVEFQRAARPPPQAATQHPPPAPPQILSTSGTNTAPASGSTGTTDNSLKRLPDSAELEERSAHQPAKRRGPYGDWSTVSVIERGDDQTTDEVKDEGGETEETKEGTEEGIDGGEIQFEEKKILGGLAEDEGLDAGLKGDFKGFSFKKRTAKGKGRPQIRQRTSDI